MKKFKTFGPAVAISLIAHGFLFWLWPAPTSERQTPLEIVLLPDTPPPEPVASVAPEIEPQNAVEPITEEPLLEEPVLEKPPPIEIAMGTEPRPLDLERPENWDEFFEIDETDDFMVLPFNPDLQARRQTRETDKKRARILADRRYEREGLPPDEYNDLVLAQSPNVSAVNFGNTVGMTHIKTAQGCFNLVQEVGLYGFETGWWITGCKGAFKSVWEQPVLLLAPNGQVDVIDL